MNLDKIKAKLEALKNQQANQGSGKTKTGAIWKPSAGKQVIRILPYPHQQDDPFVELRFYYDFGKTWLAPSQFGRPDPVIEFCNRLTQTKPTPKDDWMLSKKMEPKLRRYVPIIVRGQEDEGVKFWGFGQLVYMQLLEIISDGDYGDISDLETGTDLKIEYTPNADDPKQSKTSILAARKSSIATEDPALLDKIKNMIDLVGEFDEPSYEDLNTALQAYLTGTKPEAKPQPSNTASTQDSDDFSIDKLKGVPKGPATDTKVASDIADLEKAFEDAFNK